MAPSDCVVIFRLGLDEVSGPFRDLTQEQQQSQRSIVFERFGMFWMLSIERVTATSNDIKVTLWNLSVALDSKDLEEFGEHLKGEILVDLGNDGQERVFNASLGTICNLVGRQYPADWIRMTEGVKFELSAGRTVSKTKTVSMYCPHSMEEDGHSLGGFYLPSWKGISGVVLKNHVYDSFRDGKSIQVKLSFLGTPLPAIKCLPPAHESTSNPDHVAIFRLGLDEVEGRLFDATREQQQRRISSPFERFGMHWILTIERTAPGSKDIEIALWNLSVSLDDQALADFGHHLKGEINVGLGIDGQERRFKASEGQVCNLIGHQYPADWICMMDGVEFELCAGQTLSDQKEVTLYCNETLAKEGRYFGGFYTPNWRGIASIVLENHTYDVFRDGKSVQVKVRFLGTPIPGINPERSDGEA